MLINIVDSRKRKYRWREVNAVIEATSHDNGNKDSDQIERCAEQDYVMFEQQNNISINDAISWAESASGKVTLFLYDKGEGIS